jgi:hypothetical protein
MNEKTNCWEYMKCGREPDGANSEKLGTCPASTIEIFTGVNNGINAGRFCWKISGTMCFDSIKVKGTFASKILSCSQCPFFKKVKEEEGKDFI